MNPPADRDANVPGDAVVPAREPAATPLQRAGVLLARTDASAPMVRAAQFARKLVPPEQVARGHSTTLDRLARAVEDVNADRPSAVRELGLATVGVWQALSGRRAPDPAEPTEVTILFTDLVDFSRWALNAGDDQVLRLMQEVNDVCERVVVAHCGQVVKTLGDGMMAVFADGAEAIEAAHEATGAVSAIQVESYRPALRAGVHTGTPRAVGDDFLGVDVNIAARVCAAAGAGEVYASGPTLELAGVENYAVKRRRFKAKGVPKDLKVYRVIPRYDTDHTGLAGT
ncbi:adenylate/guanylate cyclase domain-containing protein [Gordonia sp. (in: high G+C Gram-positive bacteria)]|uniref:adenylate/guanylate cyclase domain-containing protein n=1 Tax=Gordonia sp. (in: high G+C Gram-positive bacteria) TaxID=84139 RepID=UPI003528FEE7